MADVDRPPIDLNKSSAGELTQLPGVGETLARRIVAERPYGDITDLQRVEGLGQRRIDQLSPYLTVSESEIEEEILQERAWEDEPLQREPAASRNGSLVWIAVGVAVAVLASLILNLAVLASINGGLSYSPRTTERAMAQELESLQVELSQLERRLRASEQESERLASLADRLDGAAQRLETVGSELDLIRSDLDGLQARVETTAEQAARSQMYLEGLQSLLQDLLLEQDLDQDAGGPS